MRRIWCRENLAFPLCARVRVRVRDSVMKYIKVMNNNTKIVCGRLTETERRVEMFSEIPV